MRYLKRVSISLALVLALSGLPLCKADAEELPILEDETKSDVDVVKDITVYTVDVNTAINLSTGSEDEGLIITLNVKSIENILNAAVTSPDWDSRCRYKDILILENILVDQLGISKTKAAAIIANICYEDSFAALTNSKAHFDDISVAIKKLGNGTRGYGCAQWTQSKRQNALEDYYISCNEDLKWELASIVAETSYLINELYVSDMIGNLYEDGDLENITGILACEYEAYSGHESDWYKQNGSYKSKNAARYTYAKHIYELFCERV